MSMPLGFQQIALSSTAAKLTPPATARVAYIDAEIQNARWRDDGSAPTASVGMRLLADTERPFYGNLSALQFVAETAGAVINVTYYGYFD